jgi:hypothetical protein
MTFWPDDEIDRDIESGTHWRFEYAKNVTAVANPALAPRLWFSLRSDASEACRSGSIVKPHESKPMHVGVNGVRLFFDVEGAKLVPDGPAMREKPTLLLLHGGPGFDHSIYNPAYSGLADVAQIIYLDHRGNGRSEDGPKESWNLTQWGDDVRGFCDVLGIANPIVLGASFGGMAMPLSIHAVPVIRTWRTARSTDQRCCIGSQGRAAKLQHVRRSRPHPVSAPRARRRGRSDAADRMPGGYRGGATFASRAIRTVFRLQARRGPRRA